VQADNDAYKEVWQNYPIEWQKMIENSWFWFFDTMNWFLIWVIQYKHFQKCFT
jgi:hypothetical protein